jgi:hypothetical protein
MGEGLVDQRRRGKRNELFDLAADERRGTNLRRTAKERNIT